MALRDSDNIAINLTVGQLKGIRYMADQHVRATGLEDALAAIELVSRINAALQLAGVEGAAADAGNGKEPADGTPPKAQKPNRKARRAAKAKARGRA